MASSTSHFESPVPWLALRLLAVAALAWAAGAVYTLRLNPEVAFYRRGDLVKRAWGQTLDRAYKSKTVVFGGSSCTTSINGGRMLRRHGLPVLNLGLGAGMGVKVLTRYALESLRPGDRLIMAMEPDLLAVPLDLETLGVQFSLAIGDPGLLRNPDRIDWPAAGLQLRPGGYHAFTLLGKILLRRPLYRYAPGEFHASGWQEVADRREFDGPPEMRPQLSNDARQWLSFIRDYCDKHGVPVAFSLPWGYCPPEKLTAYRQNNLTVIRQVSKFLPVLKETGLGAYTVREHYADTPWHLTAEGAAVRTDELADRIEAWETWTRQELDNQLDPSPRPPRPDGS